MIARVLLLPLLALSPLLHATEPMTDEDVVRLFVAGGSTTELLDEIDRREPAFDLSPEMLEELRRAGLSPIVIEAMRERMQTTPDTSTVPAATAPRAEPRLAIRLNADRQPGQPNRLQIAREVEPELAVEWRLESGPAERVLNGIALYVACLTPEHVPHQWRSKSPLGRDFGSTEPHLMLVFDQSPEMHYDIPATLEVPLDHGVRHDLILGIALSVGDRYYSATTDTWEGLVLDDLDLTLDALVSGERQMELRVRFDRTRGTPR